MAANATTEKYKVPAGLRPLLEALARETLRAQPTDLYNFGKEREVLEPVLLLPFRPAFLLHTSDS